MIGKTNVKVRPNKKIQFVEYIESTGTQCIDTGFKPNNNTSIEMGVLIPTSQAGKVVRFFESRNIADKVENSFGIVSFGDNNKLLQLRYNTSGELQQGQLATNTKYIIKTDKNKLYVNDNLKITHISSTFQVNYNLWLFAFKSPDEFFSYTGIYRMYYFKLWDNDILVRDFRPCKDPNGVYCLYDMVSKTYFYNQGTGSFLGGAEI